MALGEKKRLEEIALQRLLDGEPLAKIQKWIGLPQRELAQLKNNA